MSHTRVLKASLWDQAETGGPAILDSSDSRCELGRAFDLFKILKKKHGQSYRPPRPRHLAQSINNFLADTFKVYRFAKENGIKAK